MSDHLPFFVYGTLKRGFGNHAFIEANQGKYEGEGTIVGLLYVSKFNGLPFIFQGDGLIRGEVFSFKETYPFALRSIDGLEGYSHDRHDLCRYQRTKISVLMGDGRTIEAWVYFGNEQMIAGMATDGIRIENGIYRQICRDCFYQGNIHPQTECTKETKV